MAIESFERAYKILGKLQTSEDFEHFGQGSRGIRVQTDSLILGIVELTLVYPDAEEALTLIGALITKVSQDYGSYIRVKGGPRYISVDVRGLTGPVNENMDSIELDAAIMRRSGVEITTDFEGKSWIRGHSDFLKIEDQEAGVVINKELGKFSEEKRAKLADSFLNVVAREVAQSGEFLDL